MATHHTCDRCHTIETQKRDVPAVDIPILPNPYVYGQGSLLETRTVDLCINCIKQLIEFVKPLPIRSK